LEEGRKYVEQHKPEHIPVSVSLQRGNGLPKGVSVSLAWAVRYISSSGTLSIYIDVQSGKILTQEELVLKK
jgi:hypothetical protein